MYLNRLPITFKGVLFIFVFSFNQTPAYAQAISPLTQCSASHKKPQVISFFTKSAINAPYADPNREIKDLGTDLVVKELINSKDKLFYFIQLLYTSINSDLVAYRKSKGLDERAVFYCLKAANVMRIFANQVFSMVSPEATELLKKTYSDYFKRSDIDFSILVDQGKLKGLDYETTMNELLDLSYKALNKIRNELASAPKNYFSLEQMIARLPQYYEKLRSLESVLNPNNPWYQVEFSQLQLLEGQATQGQACPYEGQFDYRFELNPKDKKNIIGTPLSDKTHWIMNSINKTLEWYVPGHSEKVIKFLFIAI